MAQAHHDCGVSHVHKTWKRASPHVSHPSLHCTSHQQIVCNVLACPSALVLQCFVWVPLTATPKLKAAGKGCQGAGMRGQGSEMEMGDES